MRLYQEAAVEEIERTDAFRDLQGRIAARRALAIARTVSQQAAASALAEAIPIDVPLWDTPTLHRLSIQHFAACSRELLPDRLRCARTALIEDLATEYLVGWASSAEEWLVPLWARPGYEHATITLRVRILAEILRAYPGLFEGVARALRELAGEITRGDQAVMQGREGQ